MDDARRLMAASLLEIKAVILRPSEPFVWASGWHSPIYCDNRRILSHPQFRSWVAEKLAAYACEAYPQAECVAGVATGAIAHGALVADRLCKPFVYVRPKPKDHGTGSQIEGELPKGSGIVVIEDLISTGMSSLSAVRALRDAGAEVLGMAALFTYAFPLAQERFAEAGVHLYTLTDYPTLLGVALERGYIEEERLEVLEQWRESPSTWNI